MLRTVGGISTWLICGLALCGLPGCEPPPIDFVEVPRIDERVGPAEWQRFVRIVRSLPDEKLPPIPELYLAPPSWQPSRTLPISELLREEERLAVRNWDPAGIVRNWSRHRKLQQALARERLTTEQFVGLVMGIGLAYSRGTLREDQLPLEELMLRGRDEIDSIRRDHRQFSSLTPDEQHTLLQRATWLTRVDRADKLSQIPLENLLLVRKQKDFLQICLPESFQRNPLDEVTDHLEEQGMPFEELPGTGRDDSLRWNEPEKRLEVIDRGGPARL